MRNFKAMMILKRALAVAAVVTLFAVAYVRDQAKPPSKPPVDRLAEQRAKKNFATRALAAVSERSAKWSSLELEEFSSQGVALDLIYLEAPETIAEVRRDTEAVARAALLVLRIDGRQPASEQILIWVYGRLRTRGETGTNQLRTYGTARYNPLSDSITFEAPG